MKRKSAVTLSSRPTTAADLYQGLNRTTKPVTEITPAERDASSWPGCKQCEHGTPVSHCGSKLCRSGSLASGGHRAHCTCDTCF